MTTPTLLSVRSQLLFHISTMVTGVNHRDDRATERMRPFVWVYFEALPKLTSQKLKVATFLAYRL